MIKFSEDTITEAISEGSRASSVPDGIFYAFPKYEAFSESLRRFRVSLRLSSKPPPSPLQMHRRPATPSQRTDRRNPNPQAG